MLYAIAACEIGFWVLLGLGLITRYLFQLRRTSAVILLLVPLVDVALLIFSIVDLRRGAQPSATHALAAVYLGFSVAFGHSLITWADRKVAHRFRGGPPLPAKPALGTPARVRKEWHDWGLAVIGVAVVGAVIALLTVLVPAGADTAPLLAPLPGLGVVLAVWFFGWPVWETVRMNRRRAG